MKQAVVKRLIRAIICACVIAMLMAPLMFTVPRLKVQFAEMGADIPEWLVAVIKMSDFVSHYWYAIIAPLFLLLAAYVIGPAICATRTRVNNQRLEGDRNHEASHY